MVAARFPGEDTLLDAKRLKVVELLGKALATKPAEPSMMSVQARIGSRRPKKEQTTPHKKVTDCCT